MKIENKTKNLFKKNLDSKSVFFFQRNILLSKIKAFFWQLELLLINNNN